MNPTAMASGLGWMAWTWQTAAFFIVIALLLVGMMLWEWRSPGGAPRRGILRIVTTRGDRLFISLLLAAYRHLIWLALFGTPLWVRCWFPHSRSGVPLRVSRGGRKPMPPSMRCLAHRDDAERTMRLPQAPYDDQP
jgi:predicted small integral membrane protein